MRYAVLNSLRGRLRRSAASESGITVAEVMIAALILVIMGLAVMGMVDAATHNTYRAQQSQVVNDRLQAEIERIKQLPYSQIALTQVPAHSSDPANPDYRVSGATYALNRDGSNPEAMVYNGGASHDAGVETVTGGTIDPTPVPFSTGGVHGLVYRYVTWHPDPGCMNCQQQYLKRVVVAVTLDTTASGGTRVYQELQTDIANPDAKVNQGGPGGGGTNATPWTFWITDTPCNFTTRQPIVDEHNTHNTRGICQNELKEGNNPGAPDLMFTQAPQCANNDCTTPQPVFDYAKDVEPTVDADKDRGLQERLGPSCSNVVNGTLGGTFGNLPLIPDVLDPTYFQKVHKWVSNKIPAGFNIYLNGQGTLDLWTRSINGVVQPGKICVYLFYRQVTLNLLGQPVYADVPAINLDLGGVNYFTHSENPWPTTWTEIQVPLHFDLGVNLGPEKRLGVAISVDGSNGQTGEAGLEFMYDAPSFDSRVVVQTTSLLPW